jgi:inositol polyphosphate 5-phosphatase INPP5B/F
MKKMVSYINEQLLAREQDYIIEEPLKIFCGTFNLNGKQPDDESIKPWLHVDPLKQNDIDIYAIGFQEVVDLNTTSFLLQSDWVERERRWLTTLIVELNHNTKQTYKLVVRQRMCGIFLVIFARESLDPAAISEVLTCYVPTGIMDTVGNKGSVSISIRMYETRVCFVCSHFASDTDKLEKRNSDYRSTVQRTRFVYNANGDYYSLDEHDVIFWFGDLNYRLDHISLNDTIIAIYSSQNAKLLQYDQLTLERERKRVFHGYNEGVIDFRPTYKYLVKTDIYEKHAQFNADQATLETDETTIKKVKLPSWTDRILWKTTNDNIKLTLLKYSCINTITIR